MSLPQIEIPERFKILGQISASDEEVMLRAQDRTLHREVMLKVAGRGVANLYRDRTVRRTALREARALARIRHQGVPRILEVVETSSGPLLVLEPLTGESLHEHIEREGPLSPSEVAKLGVELAEILSVVHSSGIIHRGVSSDSILLLSDGKPCLTKFHFAKPQVGLNTESIAQSSIQYVPPGGKAYSLPEYPAPEQLQGLPADERSDIYSLGAVLYECLTGASPFADGSGVNLKSTALRKRVPRAGAELAKTIVKCLAPNPLGRYENAAALRVALENSLPAPSAGSESKRSEARRSTSRKPLIVGLAAAFVLVTGFVVKQSLMSGESRAESQRGLGGTRPSSVVTDLSDTYASSYALLIGIGDVYEKTGFPPLANAEGDIEALAEVLEGVEAERWKVDKLLGEEATGENVIESLGRLADKTAPNDRVFIYYAGHGIPHERTDTSGWIVPADGQPEKRSSWIRFDEFFRFFGESRAKHVLVAMDCCYGGRLTTGRAVQPSVFRKRFLNRAAHVVISSGRQDEQVSDGIPGTNSPFAEAFLAALENGEPITSSMLFADIQGTFTSQNVGHNPQIGYPPGSPFGGEFVFFASD